MKVLSISLDKKIFDENSPVAQRQIEYGKLFDELHIIVLTLKGYQSRKLSNNVYVYPTNSLNKIFYFFNAYKIIKKMALTDNQWLVSAQDPYETGILGYFIKIKYKIPLQLQIHIDFWNKYFKKESHVNKFRYLVGQYLIRRADCLRTVSQRLTKEIRPELKNVSIPIINLPVFVDTEKIRNSPIKQNLHEKYANYDFLILMASRIVKQKNINLVIKVMPEIVKKFSKCLLLIVGDGQEKEKLQRMALMSAPDNIIFEKWNDDLISYYKTADLFLLTSNYEGYAMTVVEAMTAGLPVLMTNVGCAGEIIEDEKNGLIIPVNNEEALTKALIKLIENPALRKKLANHSLQKAITMISKEAYLENYKKSLAIGLT